MSLSSDRRRRPTPHGRPRPVRWSLWELALLTISLVLIASPHDLAPEAAARLDASHQRFGD